MKRALVLAMLLALAGCVRLAMHAASRSHHASSTPPAEHVQGTSVPPDVRRDLEAIVKQGVPGVTAIAMRNGRELFRLDVGDIGPATQYPVASASKWVTAALVMTVVDEGKLSLDAPISAVLPAFHGEAGRTTLRELLAQTSGEGDLRSFADIRQDPRITLAESAAGIARRPLEDAPGAVFRYGGPGFQVAGAMAEAATGERWADLFAERLARPLGITHSYWTHLPDRGVPVAKVTNPLLQGGLVTTADDYLRFLTLLAQHGEYEGRRILSSSAIDAMETVETLGKPLAYVPPGATQGAQYALGNWCEAWTADRRCTRVSSPGAFGTFPWIDRASGVYGIFFLRDRLPNVVDRLVDARRSILAEFAPPPHA